MKPRERVQDSNLKLSNPYQLLISILYCSENLDSNKNPKYCPQISQSNLGL